MHMALVTTVDASAYHQLGAEVSRADAVYATLAEDAITHALALLVAGLDAVDLLWSRALGRGRLLAFRTLSTLRRLLLFPLLPLGALLLLALLPFGTLLLLVLTALNLLPLLALLALGTLHVALTLTLDLLRALALGTLDGAPLRSPLFCARLAALHSRCCSLWRRRTRSRAGCTTTMVTTAAMRTSVAILRLG
jgi:hypothetical protein